MNIASNPWSFTSADVASSTAIASPGGMIQQGTTAGEQALGTVLYTSTAPHNLTAGQFVTYITDTNGRLLGLYKVIAVPTATTALLQNISSPSSGRPFSVIIAASGGGTMLVCAWPWMVRAEDISLQGTGGAPVGSRLIMLDRNGNLIWTVDLSAAPAELTTIAAQNRGKIMWVDGITLQLVPTNVVVLVTIN